MGADVVTSGRFREGDIRPYTQVPRGGRAGGGPGGGTSERGTWGKKIRDQGEFRPKKCLKWLED